ncbi:MAG: 4-hydroxy-tetrahydrodipicolinate synthase [Rudaea sp.]
MKKLTGSICALATPFRSGALDLDAFVRLLDHQIDGGSRGVVVAGSTGEAHALDHAEYDRLLTLAVKHVAGRVPVLAGTGTANTEKTVVATRHAQSLGADAALVVTPYYVRPTQDGLVRHFSEVADRGGLPVVLYNVPGRTGCDLLAETTARLAGHERIVGIKEAVFSVERITALVALKDAQFSVLSGDDPTALHALLLGVDGVISVAANVAPVPFSAMCDAAIASERQRAAVLNDSLQPLFDILGVESNPIPVKWVLQELGIGSADVRLPLLPLSPRYHGLARQVVSALPASMVQPRHSSAA